MELENAGRRKRCRRLRGLTPRSSPDAYVPPEAGSWKLTAAVAIVGAIYTGGTAPKDTPIGNLISSAYDYVISETLGFHVDYKKTLGQQYEEMKKQKSQVRELPQSKFDALIEKCDVAIRDMHRPIVWSETASEAHITAKIGAQERMVGRQLDHLTFEYIYYTTLSEKTFSIVGRVSSYNVNTFKGRMYIAKENRPIPFELGEEARDTRSVAIVTASLRQNARNRSEGDIRCVAFRRTSKSGVLKSVLVIEVST